MDLGVDPWRVYTEDDPNYSLFLIAALEQLRAMRDKANA